jgi:hypothetical protein
MFFCSHRKLGSVKILFYNWHKFIPLLQFDFQTHCSYLPFGGRVTSHSLANTVQHSSSITLFEFQNMNSLQILACPGFLKSRLVIILSMFLDSIKVCTKFTSHFWILRDISTLPFHYKTSISLGVFIRTYAAEGRGVQWISTARSKQCHHTLHHEPASVHTETSLQ